MARLPLILTLLLAALPARACPADLNGDGFLDGGDLALFVELFLASDPRADLNGDIMLDNGDLAAYLAAFSEGCPMTNASPQSNHGAVRFAKDTASYLRTGQAAVGTGTGFNISGDLSGKKQLCMGGWFRFDEAGLDDKLVPFALTRDAAQNAPSVAGFLALGDNTLRMYARLNDGVLIQTGATLPAIGSEFFLVSLIDGDTLDKAVRFPLVPFATDEIAVYTYTEGDPNLTLFARGATAMTGANTFGCGDNGGTNAYFWQVGDPVASNPGFSCRDLFVFDDLTNLSDAVLLAIAKGEKAPMSVAGCIRWFPLDGTGESVVAGSATVTNGDLELRDIAGDINADGGLALTKNGTAPTYTADKIGPDVTSATDLIIDADPLPISLVHGQAGLGAVLGNPHKILEKGIDSYEDNQRRYATMAAIMAVGATRFPVVGHTIGAAEVAINNNTTITMDNIVVPSPGAVNQWARQSAFDNRLMRDTAAVFRFLPTDLGGSEIYNGDAVAYIPAAAGLLTTVRVRGDLFKSSSAGTRYDWLADGDKVRLRVMSYNYSGINWYLKAGDAAELRALAGQLCALPRWSIQGNPLTESPRVLGSEEFWWWAAQPTATVASGEAAFALSSPSGIGAAKAAHILALSAHKVNEAGSPLPGWHLLEMNMSGATDANFSADADPTGSTGKNFKYSQALEYAEGAKWGDGAAALVIYNADDTGSIDLSAYVTLQRAKYAAMGVTKVHFLLVANWTASQSGQPDLFTLRNDKLSRMQSYLDFAAGRTDCTVVPVFSYYGGAMPGGYSEQTGRFEPIGTAASNLFGGYPLRELRAATASVEALGIPLLGAATILGDNVHIGSGTNGQANSESINSYWLNQILALPSGGQRSRDRSRQR